MRGFIREFGKFYERRERDKMIAEVEKVLKAQEIIEQYALDHTRNLEAAFEAIPAAREQ